MIVDSMTHAEVYQELERDREAVTRWWYHNLEAQRRRVLKSTRFPVQLWFEHTSPRKNRYFFVSHVDDKRMKRVMTGLLVPRLTADGLTVYVSWLSTQKIGSPLIFTPHMFRRYAERANVPKKGIELVRHFINRNPYGRVNRDERLMPRSVRYNGEEHKASCVPDGVLLGHIIDGIFIVRTFITYEMTSGLQQQEFETCRDELVGLRDMHDLVQRFNEP